MSRADAKQISRVLGGRASTTRRRRRRGGSPSAPTREGLADVAYASFDSPLGVGHVAATERGIVSIALPNARRGGVPRPARREVSPRVLELPARLDRGPPRARPVLRRPAPRVRPRARLAAGAAAASTSRVLRETAKLPYGVTASYGEVAARAGNAARLPRRRHRARPQPDPDRRPLPPRAPRRRRARRLRRRPGDEGVACCASRARSRTSEPHPETVASAQP